MEVFVWVKRDGGFEGEKRMIERVEKEVLAA